MSGVGGTWASSSRKVSIEGSDHYSTGDYGTAASGGSIGTVGTSKGYTTYYLNGIYARISSLDASGELKTYKCDDYVSKDDVIVYAIYSTNSADTVSDTIDRIALVANTTDGFADAITVGTTNSNTIRAHKIENEYWNFVSQDSSGEHQITSGEIKSITATDTSMVKTGKINVELNTNSFASSSTFVRDIRIAMDAQQTINKEDGTDNTKQDALGDYPTSGDAAVYNNENAVKTIIYDNESHTIAELIAGTGYGKSNGVDSSAEITDAFFKNGLTTNSGEAYWYADYAQDPYYKVEYKPFNTFIDYSATNASDVQGDVRKEGTNLTYGESNYLTGSDAPTILGGTKYSDTANLESGEYVLNGETDKYFAEGQIDKQLIKNAGIYTVTVVVPYRYFTYTYTGDTWYGDTVSNDNYSYFFRTYTFNIVVREADLGITEATDTVYENTKVQSHTFDRYVEGQNDEQVYGKFTYASDHGEEWGNSEDRIVNKNQTKYTDIEWEFNVYEDEYIDNGKNKVDGHKNINNYLCQVDGTSAEAQKLTSKDIQNTYYKGSNGALLYTSSAIATRDANMLVVVNHVEEQNDISRDNRKIESSSLNRTGIFSIEKDREVKSIYGEDIEVSAMIISDSLGWRVVKGDAVTGNTKTGTKIESSGDLAEGYQTDEYYNKLIEEGKYKGDLYIVTVSSGDEVIKTFEYTDESAKNTVNNIQSELAKQVTDELPACEYYGIPAYDVKVEYIGLYYTGETSTNGRLADWNGEEEFNWVTSETNFKLDIEQRDVTIKDTADFNKIYDSTRYLIQQSLTNGDVTSGEKYIVDLAQENSDTQFSKKPNALLYNYIDPTDNLTNTMSIELAGEYDSKNKGAQKEVTIIDARWLDGNAIPESGDRVAALNYHIVDGNSGDTGIATVTGNIDVAQMHYIHEPTTTMTVRDNTPLHELFGISAKAYLLDATKEDNSEFMHTMTMSELELVEKNDEKTKENNTFETSGEAYDYDATYHINTDDYKQYITGSNLAIDEDTGKILTASTVTKGGTNPSNFPAIDVKLADYANFTVVLETEETETSTYNECLISQSKNSKTESGENVEHTIRFRIVGNNNNYDLFLPINQLNKREVDSVFLRRTADIIFAGENEYYRYVAVYPNEDSAEFEFTIPQDSYLKDVAIVALEDYNMYDTEATMKTYEELVNSVNEGTAKVIGTYETQADEGGMNTIENAIFMTLDEVNGTSYTETKLQEPNEQIGGSTFKYTLTTGESNLGEEYVIVIVPLIGEYDQNILADDAADSGDVYESNLSVEKTITSSGDSTLTYDVAQDDYVYVNYKTLFDTTTGGTVTMSYEGSGELVIDVDEDNMNEYNTIAINANRYPDFFNPEKMAVGTEVTIKLEVWRNGVIQGIQKENDEDAFDTVTFTWVVSQDDYNRLFMDDVIILPVNQINERGTDGNSHFINQSGENIMTISAESGETYSRVNTGLHDDYEVEFDFTIPQDSYLKDVLLVNLEDYNAYDELAEMPTYEEIQKAVKNNTAKIVTSYTAQSGDSYWTMTIDEINGEIFDATVIPEAMEQIGGSTYKMTLRTDDEKLGYSGAFVIVPLTEEYNLIDDSYESNLSVEKAITNSGDSTLTHETAQEDYVYVNYKTLSDTSAGGTVTMSYEGSGKLELTLDGNNMNEFNSFAINTEDNTEFFNPETLIPGTAVTISLEVWRDGAVDAMQRSGDNDAFDLVTFTWTVSEEDYYRLFKDDVVTIRRNKTMEEDDKVETSQVIDNILGYVLSGDEAFNNISKYVTNHKTNMETQDEEWSVQSNFDLLGKYIEGIYNVDETEMKIDETTYQVEGLSIGMSVYPYKTYFVTFDANGGSEVASQEIEKGKVAAKPEDPTYGELHFAGWFVDPTLDNIYKQDSEEIMGYSYNTFDFATPITEDIELKALWTPVLQVNTSGVGSGMIASAMGSDELEFDEEHHITSIYDNSIILGLNNTVKLGAKEDEDSVFIKWTKDGEDYSTDRIITVTITENTEFVAVFDELEYTVTYDANGGTGTMSGETTKHYIFPDCEFTAPAGNEFDKWDVNGTQYEAGDVLTLTENITVKATWKYKPSRSSGGGGGGSSSSTFNITTTVPKNGTISPENPKVTKNDSQKFTFSADAGYEIEDVVIDGVSMGPVSSYTLENVKAKHTIELKVKKAEAEDKSGDNIWGNASEWAIKELNDAEGKKLIPETFAKQDFTKAITRKEFAAIAVKMYEAITKTTVEPVANNPFTDTNDEYVLKAYAVGITLGTSETTFTPDMLITREQMATMLTRGLNKAEINVNIDLNTVNKFVDDNEMHEWGRNAIYFMATNDIIKGIGDNKFGTLSNATVEQALAIALRSVNVFAK